MAETIASSKGDSAEPTIAFDKDDEDTLDFVTASANLRSIVFGIEAKSRFDIKQMAGNIIPAIATTNAIVAGLCVLQSFKVLRGEFTSTKEVYNFPIFKYCYSNLTLGLPLTVCTGATPSFGSTS
jgi:ubiquitin-like 1-activating enzyme E1 B